MFSTIGFIVGIIFGSIITRYLVNLSWESEEWNYFRWNSDILGYRTVAPNKDGLLKIKPGEKIVIGFTVDTTDIPPEFQS